MPAIPSVTGPWSTPGLEWPLHAHVPPHWRLLLSLTQPGRHPLLGAFKVFLPLKCRLLDHPEPGAAALTLRPHDTPNTSQADHIRSPGSLGRRVPMAGGVSYKNIQPRGRRGLKGNPHLAPWGLHQGQGAAPTRREGSPSKFHLPHPPS